MALDGRNKLKGVVEVDEVLIGGKKPGKRGRGAEGKSLIVVAVEVIGRKTGRTRISKIPDASAESLEPFIERNIEKGSKVITDGWPSYSRLTGMEYGHEIQMPNIMEDNQEILPNVHRIASLLKRWSPGTHQSYVNKNKMGYYLDEYVFRYNRRTSKSRGLLFLRLIEQAVSNNPISFNQIVEQNHGF
ncbi:hypothetical protein MNBD_BACTEROID03-2312 [hydrothermal vent metagenome]|uniref:ISXO2-like transposase domain-containing protein n=1 Tax=hydrothermal vent metagenome TaxID=652676 RepID=A0A3B0TZZ7_9ZZZZ